MWREDIEDDPVAPFPFSVLVIINMEEAKAHRFGQRAGGGGSSRLAEQHHCGSDP